MDEFFVFLFLILSTFAFNAFCMNPLHIVPCSPPAPANVEFGECFDVIEATGGTLNTDYYNYRHICPKKLPEGSESPQDEKVWYVVGALGVAEPLSLNKEEYDYVEIQQSLIAFTFLKEAIVEFVIGPTDPEFRVIFHSLHQSQTFYAMIYPDMNMSQAAPKKIGVLHEITKKGDIKMGNDVEALHENIDGTVYITLKNALGKPLLVFSKNEALIMRFESSPNDKQQVLLRVHMMHYILTFSSQDDAQEFSNALLDYVKELNVDGVFPMVKSRFQNNRITIDS